jgi:hypothetical protein
MMEFLRRQLLANPLKSHQQLWKPIPPRGLARSIVLRGGDRGLGMKMTPARQLARVG